MKPAPLTSAEKKELRGIAQRLKPHVHVGRQGLSPAVMGEIETALLKNGLVKIRFDGDRSTIRDYCDTLPPRLGCEFVGLVGKVGVFFRDMPDES